MLLVGHGADPYPFPELDMLGAALGEPERAVIPNGHVPLEFTAEAFAAILIDFLDRPDRDKRVATRARARHLSAG